MLLYMFSIFLPQLSLVASLFQVVTKLHSILRPFLLRRMKENVEHMLPRKKEIILYANMTDHQKQIQEHLVNKTFENYLEKEADDCKHSFIKFGISTN